MVDLWLQTIQYFSFLLTNCWIILVLHDKDLESVILTNGDLSHPAPACTAGCTVCGAGVSPSHDCVLIFPLSSLSDEHCGAGDCN